MAELVTTVRAPAPTSRRTTWAWSVGVVAVLVVGLVTATCAVGERTHPDLWLLLETDPILATSEFRRDRIGIRNGSEFEVIATTAGPQLMSSTRTSTADQAGTLTSIRIDDAEFLIDFDPLEQQSSLGWLLRLAMVRRWRGAGMARYALVKEQPPPRGVENRWVRFAYTGPGRVVVTVVPSGGGSGR